jgi:hypothetical protein
MGFDYPWVLLLAVVILPLFWVLGRSESLTRAVVRQFRSIPPTTHYFRSRLGFAAVFTLSLLLTGASPYIEPDQTGDFLFLVDSSRSMQARMSCDEPTFLDRAKNVMEDIMEGVPEARFGILAFDRLTFPITQLTYDHSYLRSVISNALFVGMTYRATDTNLINALSVVADKKQTLPQLYQDVEYVILLSDGYLDEDDWRQNLEQPLKDLMNTGITLLVVGIGNPVDTPVPETDQNGQCADTMMEIDGKLIRIPMRKDILQAIATGSQGQYYEEGQTDQMISYIRNETLSEVDKDAEFGLEQRKHIGWLFLMPAAAALFGLFLL